MDPTRIRRLGTMMIASALLAAACSGGFGGASPSAAPSAPASVAPSAEPSVAAEEVTLTYLVDDTEATQARAAALTEAYTALHPNVTFEIETRLGGTDGDNIVKTRLVDRRDDGHLLVQLRLAPAGAQPRRVTRGRLRGALDRQHQRVVSADGFGR